MSDIAIKVQGLGKQYHLGAAARGGRYNYRSLRDVLAGAVTAPFRRNGHGARTDREFWALKDIDFEVRQGEVVGIIGRNGAGKSTLLKIISRITDPSKGQAEVVGRVGSLLEVGTGFHPELTGRENIFLNGAILGMRRAEIGRRFDEIVAFADIEGFLDTAVKYYSSGMYTRLAFAVAAHLEPEILLVDEVLAVGDAAFQKKCLGKMSDISKDGRTVLFVSHQMGAITTLCSKAMVLVKGNLKGIGPATQMVAEYLASGAERSGYVDLRNAEHRRGSGEVRLTDVFLRNQRGELVADFSIGDDLLIEFGFDRVRPIRGVRMGVRLTTADGLNLAHMIDQDSGFALPELLERELLQMRLNDLRLYPGSYLLSFWIGDPTSTGAYDEIEHCIQFDVVGGGALTGRPLPRSAGVLFLTPQWQRLPVRDIAAAPPLTDRDATTSASV